MILRRKGARKEKEEINFVISDTHVGQLITKRWTRSQQIEYDKKMIPNYFTQFAKCMRHLGGYSFQKINVIFLGDMVEGEGIFPGQPYEIYDMDKQEDIVKEGFSIFFDAMHQYMPSVPIEVVCIYGNHGRTDKRNSILNNYDIKFYKAIKDWFRQDDWIDFHIEKEWYYVWENNGFRHFLSHKGNLAIQAYAGIPYYGIRDKSVKWYSAKDIGPFDMAIYGHWHTIDSNEVNQIRIMMNGAGKYNDYPMGRMALDPSVRFQLFGSGKYPRTWNFEVDVDMR